MYTDVSSDVQAVPYWCAWTVPPPRATSARPPMPASARAIRDGSLAPGERLTEVDLATRFGVSRTPVRQAIARLEAEGLLTHEARRGLVGDAPRPPAGGGTLRHARGAGRRRRAPRRPARQRDRDRRHGRDRRRRAGGLRRRRRAGRDEPAAARPAVSRRAQPLPAAQPGTTRRHHVAAAHAADARRPRAGGACRAPRHPRGDRQARRRCRRGRRARPCPRRAEASARLDGRHASACRARHPVDRPRRAPKAGGA